MYFPNSATNHIFNFTISSRYITLKAIQRLQLSMLIYPENEKSWADFSKTKTKKVFSYTKFPV